MLSIRLFMILLLLLFSSLISAEEEIDAEDIAEVTGIFTLDGNGALKNPISHNVTAASLIFIASPHYDAADSRAVNLDVFPLEYHKGSEYKIKFLKSKSSFDNGYLTNIQRESVLSVDLIKYEGKEIPHRQFEIEKAYSEKKHAAPKAYTDIKDKFPNAAENDLEIFVKTISDLANQDGKDFLIHFTAAFGRPDEFKRDRGENETIFLYVIRSPELIERIERIEDGQINGEHIKHRTEETKYRTIKIVCDDKMENVTRIEPDDYEVITTYFEPYILEKSCNIF